jgi:indole-3-glycerol phosphate synthase
MILDKIVEDKKLRLPEHKARVSEQEMRSLAEEKRTVRFAEHTFYENLKKPGISIIGEFKKASPSLGNIKSKIDLMERIGEYNASVDAISCLTEEDHFCGNVDYLRQIREKSPLPILRKDFMIDEYQFYEAKVIGADAVLLITAILDDVQMHDFYQLARELNLDVLVETHDEAEVERALKIDPRIIGVNNRNLKDFSISLENTKRLRRYVPQDKVFIAESGIMDDQDVAFLKEVGMDGFLIGRAFMEAENPQALARRWKAM